MFINVYVGKVTCINTINHNPLRQGPDCAHVEMKHFSGSESVLVHQFSDIFITADALGYETAQFCGLLYYRTLMGPI